MGKVGVESTMNNVTCTRTYERVQKTGAQTLKHSQTVIQTVETVLIKFQSKRKKNCPFLQGLDEMPPLYQLPWSSRQVSFLHHPNTCFVPFSRHFPRSTPLHSDSCFLHFADSSLPLYLPWTLAQGLHRAGIANVSVKK